MTPETHAFSESGYAVPLVVDLDGFEGPLDVLLALARTQKIDVTRISILQLADQYLAFIAEARLSLEVAADYLVMAAWLAYLKSRLLLPEADDEDELSGPELAAQLAFRLQRLDAMREAAGRLMQRDRLGRDVFRRGAPEGVRAIRHPTLEASLFELLSAYATMRRPGDPEPLRIALSETLALDDALQGLTRMLGISVGWERLESFLPPGMSGGFRLRTGVASTLAAGLEMARQGKAQLRQDAPFGPIYIRARRPAES